VTTRVLGPLPLAAVAGATLVLTSSCAHAPQQVRTFHGVPLASNITCTDFACSTYNVAPDARVRSRYGVGCMGNTYPGARQNPRTPPQSYLVADIGKPDFPRLTASETNIVRRIQRYVHSQALRIAWVHKLGGGRKFIVFDATDGPCAGGSALGDQVLNGNCNEYYAPGENPYGTHPGPGGCVGPKRPWLDNEWPNLRR
jgi:hypothetical protein